MQYSITTRAKNGGIQYIISYKDGKQWRQKSKQGFASVGDAKAAAMVQVKKIERELKQQSALKKEYEGKTFKEFGEMYIKHITLYRAANTVIEYSIMFKAFATLNDIELCKIKLPDIQCCIDKMVKDKFKSSTIKAYLTRLHTAFKYAAKMQMVTVNPAINIDVIENKMGTEKRALNKAELKDLLSKIKNIQYYLVSLIAAKCGLRIGEILGLTWDNIDYANGVIHVLQQWKIKLDGKDDYKYGFGELKSKNSKRDVPMPPIVTKELKQYAKEYPVNITNRLFNFANTMTVSTELRYIYKKAGYNISVHELRHTYATTLIANGMDFKTVAKLMGHDVQQTLRIYSHVTDDMIQNVKKLINKIM